MTRDPSAVLVVCAHSTVSRSACWIGAALHSGEALELGARLADWLIEHSLHWVLDVKMNEDASRIRRGNAA